MGEPLLIADPLQKLPTKRVYVAALEFRKRQQGLHREPFRALEICSLKGKPKRLISEVGMRNHSCFTDSMEKSIFSPEQEVLQELLRQIRQGAGLRQEDLAVQLHEPQSFVSKYESGERRLDLIEVRKICGVIGVPLAEFVRRFEENLRTCNRTQPSSDSKNRSGPT